VNTFLNPDEDKNKLPQEIQLSRASYEEKNEQLNRLFNFQEKNKACAKTALEKLKQTIISGGNIFEELLHTTRYASLGEITETLYAVGGQYRRAM
jgi:methylmalonyl-CoA mutase